MPKSEGLHPEHEDRGRIRLEDLPDVMTVTEAARFLGLSRNSAYEAARRKEIHTIRIGRRLLVPKVTLQRMLAEDGHGQVMGGGTGPAA